MKIRGLISVFAGFLMTFTQGPIYTIGNLTPYIASYLKERKGINLKLSDVAWVEGFRVVGMGSVLILTGILDRNVTRRVVVLLGCIVLSVGYASTYLSVNANLPAVVATLGLVVGSGSALYYSPPIACAMEWFPDNKSLVSGFILAGLGIGGFVWGQIETVLINPNNVKPDNITGIINDSEVLDRIPRAFGIMAAIIVGLQCIALILLTDNPTRKQPDWFGWRKPMLRKNLANCVQLTSQNSGVLQSNDVTSGKTFIIGLGSNEKREEQPPAAATDSENQVPPTNNNQIVSLTPKQIFKTREFWLLWFTGLLNGEAIVGINALYKSYGETIGINDDQFLSWVGSGAALFNCCSRLLWGFLLDRFTYRTTMFAYCILVGVFYCTFQFSSFMGRGYFAVWVFLLNLTVYGNPTLYPSVVADTFGPEFAGPIFGVIMAYNVIVGPISAVLSSEIEPKIGYLGIFYIMAGLVILSMFLTAFFRGPRTGKSQHDKLDNVLRRKLKNMLQSRQQVDLQQS